ncbi:hypothetical protein PIB30_114132, partial [Stylosanthes scabra]|nr:hypothetical protein [Stylosanthes scabra]
MAPDSDAKLLERLKLSLLEKQEDEKEDGFLFSQLTLSVVVPLAVRTTIELGVFDIIAKAGEGAKLSAKTSLIKLGPTTLKHQQCWIVFLGFLQVI